MDEVNQIIHTISLSMGAAWASGINLYATLLTLGVLGATGNMTLPPDLQILTNPLVIGAAGLMFAVEFVADKMPGVDTGWDSIHTFIRIPAGAMLAAASLGEVNSAMTVTAAILGGTLAAGSHATKAGSRVLINTSPEPFSNWFASLGEDVAVIVGVWAALAHPYVFLVVLVILILLMIWLLPKLWASIKKVFSVLGRLFTGNKETPPSIDNQHSP
ncbi:MAG: DUF4126 domain-containing protein [Proteobacteria bacterium]|nr:DUF4126 domain-containing protein [Pseudomonadota bacterium]MBU4295004.1 DUF4126 domain-containing protein [Pseudomonadota bacterium]MCG2746645.1 DUF4126 domain-containing protein [Desulfobulbaceae bacterium]